MDEQSPINRRKPMRLSVPTSTAPLPTVTAPCQPLRTSSLSYAVPRLRSPLPTITAIVAYITLLAVLTWVAQQTAAWLIENQEQHKSAQAIDNMLIARVQWMVASGNNERREIAESEEDYRDRRERFAHLCGRAGVAHPEK
jgi:hypothetical protein